MLLPNIIEGIRFVDDRGLLFYNNNVDFSLVKRCYIIENNKINPIRAWRGHKIEQRWFIAITGNFIVKLIHIDNWSLPNRLLPKFEFVLNSNSFNVLHIPPGYISSIESIDEGSKLFAMSDYGYMEINDDYQFPIDYFNF